MTTQLISETLRLGLPGRYYTDPDIFAREMKTLWRSTWQWVGRVEDLPDPGDYLTCMLGEEPILVLRDPEGELRAMHNICPHRGARLLMQEQGHCDRHISCPYHAWTYDLHGQLVGISQPKLFPDFDKSGIQLLAARVDTWGGFIFVNPDPTGESLADYLAEYPEYLRQWQFNWEDLRQVDYWHYDEAINWKFIVENYVEDYHFAVTHAKSLTSVFDVETIGTLPTGRHTRIPVPFAKKEPGRELQRSWEAEGVSYQGFIFPNIMINTAPNHVSVFRLIPQDATHTRLEVFIYQTPEQFGQASFQKGNYDEVMEEDFIVCRLLQAGVRSRAYQVVQLAEEHELGVTHFHQVLSQYY